MLADDDSFMSVVYKVEVTFKNGQRTDYCLKVPTCEKIEKVAEVNFFPILSIIHNKECDFYESSQKIDGLRLPEVFSLKRLTDEDRNAYVLMEFLHGRCVPVEESLNLEQIKDVAEQVALILNFSLNNPDITARPENRTFSIAGNDDEHFAKMNGPIVKYLRKTPEMQELHDLVEKHQRILSQRDYFEYIVFQAHLDYGVPNLLAHGDLWSNNLFFHGNKVEAIIDWQSLNAGNPTQDLVRLLLLNCSPDFRHKYESTVLKHCYDHLSKLQGKPLEFSFENFEKSAKTYAIYQIYLGLYILTHKYSKPERTLQRKVFVERMAAGLRDSLDWINQNANLRKFK
uniref:CHK domain-containing protein n=2 Tax=Bursaphelenchus xylophilus TaxID=6326 RepID=A0A1I7S0F4_BURXY